jgi:SAM-dependent methyltransferase
MNTTERFFKISGTEYERYARAAWQRYIDAPSRAEASLAAVADIKVQRVLDIGCGAGHELIPFIFHRGGSGVGLDVVPETGRAGFELFETIAPQARLNFVRGAAEALPFGDGYFDVVVCRLALPYMENDRALGEMARVIRCGGALLLKIHHAAYYLRKIADGLRNRDALSVVHAARVLLAGSIYYATNRQPRTRLTGGETFQTRGLLRRKLSLLCMLIERELPDSNSATPSFVIRKSA